MRDLVENILPWLLPGFGALLGVQALLWGRFPSPGFSLINRVVWKLECCASGWRARGVGFPVLLGQLFLAPLVGPPVGTWLGLRIPPPIPSPDDPQGEFAQMENRHHFLTRLRSEAEKQLAEARAHQLGDSPDDEYQRKVDSLTAQIRNFDTMEEKMRQLVDQRRHLLEEQQRANEQRARSRLCVARTCEGLLILSLSLGLALALTITSGVRHEAAASRTRSLPLTNLSDTLLWLLPNLFAAVVGLAGVGVLVARRLPVGDGRALTGSGAILCGLVLVAAAGLTLWINPVRVASTEALSQAANR